MGDFNIHVDTMSDSLAARFCDIIDSMGLKQHVTGPTHSAGHTLDLVITRATSLLVHELAVTDPGISDHSAISLLLHIEKPPTVIKQIQYRKIKAINVSKFIDDLNASALINHPANDLEDILSSYNKTLSNTLDTHASL